MHCGNKQYSQLTPNRFSSELDKMPLESGNSSSGPRFSGFAEDLGGYYAKDAFRERLHFLFTQIEKEFDTLYMENLNRKLPTVIEFNETKKNCISRPSSIILQSILNSSPGKVRSPGIRKWWTPGMHDDPRYRNQWCGWPYLQHRECRQWYRKSR